MRTHDTPSRDQQFALNVYVYNSSGTLLSALTNLSGRDWVRGIRISQSIDQSVSDLELQLAREEYDVSLSPLQGNSPLNASAVLLQIGNIVTVSVTDSSDEHEIFRGRIDSIEWSGDPIVVRARDMAADLQDRYSEVARMYAVGRITFGVRLWSALETVETGEWIAPERLADTGATAVYEVTAGGTFSADPPSPWPTHYNEFSQGTATLRRVTIGSAYWQASTAYLWGDVVKPTDDGPERMICIRAGTSGITEPTFPDPGGQAYETAGGVTWAGLPEDSDGGIAVEALMGAIIRDNYGTGFPDIYAPVGTGYWRNPFIMQEASVLETLRNLALEIGWDLRLVYVPTENNHATMGRWRLTLYEPSRSSTTADATLTADDVYGVTQCNLSLASIRNVVQVTYSEMDIGGTEQLRKTVKVTDASSILKYGRRFFGIGEGSASGINTSTEATALANAVLSDLKDPAIDFSVTLPLTWWLEINDLIEFPSTGHFPQFNSQQKLAVVNIQHDIRVSGNQYSARTTIGTRGKPTAGIKGWFERAQGPGSGKPATGFRPPSAGTVVVENSVKGASVSFSTPVKKFKKPRGGYGADAQGEYEDALLYVSDSSGFTPSSSTLKATTYSNRFDITGLDTGTPQYGRIVLRDKLGNLSAPSPEFTITPLQASLGDLDDGLKIASGAAMSGTQSLSNSDGSYLVTFDASGGFNDGGGYDYSNAKFVTPANGIYQVYAQIEVSGHAVGDYFRLDLHKNGTKTREGFIRKAADTDYLGLFLSTIIPLNENDYIEAYLYKTATSGSLSIRYNYAFFTVVRVWSR